MLLVDLKPRWFTMGESPDVVGITFDCPCCNGEQRLGVLFDVEIDRDGLTNDVHWSRPGKKWHRQGDDFETLTLTPSIDCSESGHWHGCVTAGRIQ